MLASCFSALDWVATELSKLPKFYPVALKHIYLITFSIIKGFTLNKTNFPTHLSLFFSLSLFHIGCDANRVIAIKNNKNPRLPIQCVRVRYSPISKPIMMRTKNQNSYFTIKSQILLIFSPYFFITISKRTLTWFLLSCH